MTITRKFLEGYFPGARISSGLLGWFKVKLPSGASVRIASDGKMKNFRGSDIYPFAMRLLADIGGGSATVTGNAQHVMLSALYGAAAGVEVNAGKQGWFGPPVPPVPRLTGSHGSASIATPDMLRAAGLIGGVAGKGLRIGEDSAGNIIRYQRQCGISIIGPPRTGKQATVATTMLVENEDSSWLVADGKLELLAITERRRKALGPVRKIVPFKEHLPESLQHHAAESDSFNPLYFMNPRSEGYVIENDLLAATLIVPDGGESSEKNSFFVELAQGIASGLDMYLVEFEPDKATLPRMAEIASTAELFDIGQFAVNNGSPAMKARLAVVGDENAKKMQGGINDILRTLRRGIKWLCDPTMQRVLQTPEKPWRPGDLKRERMTIYVGVPSKFAQAAQGLIGLFFGWSASDLIGTAPDKFPVKLLADEFHTFGAIDIFSTGFSEGAGHGMALIPICQTAGQLVTVWGPQGYRNIQAGCELQVFLPPRDPEQAREIETLAGTRSILTGSYSQGGRRGETGSISIGESGMPVLDAHTAAALGADQMVIYAPGLVKDIIIAHRKPYWKYPDIARWCDPNPYAPGYKEPTKTARVKAAPANGNSNRRMVERLTRALEEAAKK